MVFPPAMAVLPLLTDAATRPVKPAKFGVQYCTLFPCRRENAASAFPPTRPPCEPDAHDEQQASVGDAIEQHAGEGTQHCPPAYFPGSLTSGNLSNSTLYRPPFVRSTRRTYTVCTMSRVSASMWRSEERRVGKEGRSRWSPYH